mgnify:CR=1 FL=1
MKHKSIYANIFTGAFFVDQLSKLLAVRYLAEADVPLLSFLSLSLSFNRAMSWGILNGVMHLSVATLHAVVLVLLGAFAYAQHRKGVFIVPEIMVLAGGFSNLFDRVYRDGVVDYLDFYVGAWHWPTFNVADMFVVLGFGMIFWRVLRHGNVGQS